MKATYLENFEAGQTFGSGKVAVLQNVPLTRH